MCKRHRLNHLPAEGHKGQFKQFHMLPGKGNTYDSHEKEEGKNQVHQGGV